MNSKGPRVCLDKILPWELRNPRPQESLPPLTPGGRERAIMPIAKRWPAGTKLGVRFLGGTDSQHQMIVSTVVEWMKHCGIEFSFNEAPDAEVRISFHDDGAWSYVGTDVADIPLHAATMNFGWLDEGTILHEFGHTLGLGHEHQNPAGGIQWNEAKVFADLAGPPNFWNEAKVRHNVLRKYQLDHINGTIFDPKSIMLYAFPGDWTLSGVGTQENSALSDTDKAFIGSMYPKAGEPAAEVVALTVGEVIVRAAAIGDPGEEDLFSFNVPSDGRYVVETKGDTDVVMKLFGPDSRSALVDEDDDSGEARNARIEAELPPGKFTVQVRHFSEGAGTGDYGVSVTRFND